MPYARTSLRAEQRAVREKMRALGLSHRQIAFELARRYGLRPRAAWRHAYGWSLKEAAEQINSHAGATGLDTAGAATMTGPHLCEYENWPGAGVETTGRRPTPLVLALLAATYNTSVHDLLDLADYEHMPPGDRLILSKAAPAEEHGHRPEAGKSQPPPGPGGQARIAPRQAFGVMSGVAGAAPQPRRHLNLPDMPGATEVYLPGAMTQALNLDQIQHIAAALVDARRYADSAVAGYFAGQLAACAASDGRQGPKETLPLVLAIIAAVEHAAREAKPAVRSALLSVGARGAEFAGWLYRDRALPQVAGFWHDRAAEWAQIAGDHALQGYVLLKRSQVAWDDRDAPRMLMLAQAVQDGRWDLPPRVMAEAAQQEARGHAMLGGDIGLAKAKLDKARALLAKEGPTRAADGAPLAVHYGAPLLAMQTAICYCEAGQPARAVEIYQQNLTADAFSRRDYGYFRALAAAAMASAGRPDDAAAAGREALQIAADVGSVRTLRELARLLEQLRHWPDRPAVREFRDELAATLNQAR